MIKVNDFFWQRLFQIVENSAKVYNEFDTPFGFIFVSEHDFVRYAIMNVNNGFICTVLCRCYSLVYNVAAKQRVWNFGKCNSILSHCISEYKEALKKYSA